jgi:hypothetical protein
MEENLTKALEHVSGAIQDVTGIFKSLAGPLADEVGQMLGDKAREYRFRNAVKIFQRTEKMLNHAGLSANPIPPRLFLPAIQAASTENDETLQELWAALLANASQGRGGTPVLPSFVEVLKEMTPEEARLMKKVWQVVTVPRSADGYTPRDRGHFVGNFASLESLEGLGEPTTRMLSERDLQVALMIDDIVRLGLLARFPWYPVQGSPPTGSSALAGLGEPNRPGDSEYFLTPFGWAFMQACDPPR